MGLMVLVVGWYMMIMGVRLVMSYRGSQAVAAVGCFGCCWFGIGRVVAVAVVVVGAGVGDEGMA